MAKSFLPSSEHGALLDVLLVVRHIFVVVEMPESERQPDDFRISFHDFCDPGLDGRNLLVLADLDGEQVIAQAIFDNDVHFKVF